MKFCTNYQFWGIISSSWHNDSGARTIFMFAQKKDREEKFEMVWPVQFIGIIIFVDSVREHESCKIEWCACCRLVILYLIYGVF